MNATEAPPLKLTDEQHNKLLSELRLTGGVLDKLAEIDIDTFGDLHDHVADKGWAELMNLDLPLDATDEIRQQYDMVIAAISQPPEVNGEPLTQATWPELRLDQLGLPESILNPLYEADVSTLGDVHRLSENGTDWSAFEEMLSEDDLELLQAKYDLTLKQVEGEKPANSEEKPAEERYLATLGRGDYRHAVPVSVAASAASARAGSRSTSAIGISIPRSGEGEAGVGDEMAHRFFDHVVLDLCLCEEGDPDQGSLDGMEPDTIEPVYGIAEIKSVAFKPETIKVRIALKGAMQHIDLSRFAKRAATLRFNVLEHRGEITPLGEQRAVGASQLSLVAVDDPEAEDGTPIEEAA